MFFLGTRLYNITLNPPSVYWDEASIGYSAYSVTTDFKDEWGNLLPLHFRSFGEFKLPVYVYSVAIFEKMMGMNPLSVRLPAVLFTLGIILLIYLLVLKITNSKMTANFAAFFVSITPWLFIFSRTGYEATAGLMFYLLGINLFVFFLETKDKIKLNLIFVGIILSFILSVYSYNSFRIYVPATLVLMFFNLAIKNIEQPKNIVVGVMISIILIFLAVFPIYRLYKFDAGASRFGAVGILNVSKDPVQVVINFSNNYLSHFSFNFLFTSGDKNPRSQLPGWGELFILDWPLLLLGLLVIVQKRKFKMLLPLILLLLAPIPASLTKEAPHALRSILMPVGILIIVAIGVNYLIEKTKHKKVVIFFLVSAYLMFFANYYQSFLTNYPIKFSQEWQYGYKQLYLGYKNDFSKFDHIYISDEYVQPYIFGLYYLRVDPLLFRKTVKYNYVGNWGFSTVESYSNFKFGKVNKMEVLPNSLIFADPSQKMKDKQPFDEIKFLNGQTAFYVYKT